jgi:hypothetical protein
MSPVKAYSIAKPRTGIVDMPSSTQSMSPNAGADRSAVVGSGSVLQASAV